VVVVVVVVMLSTLRMVIMKMIDGVTLTAFKRHKLTSEFKFQMISSLLRFLCATTLLYR